jgi:hypothetical protein
MLYKELVFLFFVLGLLIPGVSADVFVTGAENVYNLGDDFSFNVNLNPIVQKSDFLSVKIKCSSGTVDIFRGPYSLGSGQSKDVLIEGKFDFFLAGSLSGDCKVEANYGGEIASSSNFELSDEIEVDLNADKILFNPGEIVKVSGSAVKKNGKLVKGVIELSLDGIISKVSADVSDGKFSVDFTLPKDIPSKQFDLTGRVFERDSVGEIINEGKSETKIKIKQIVKGLDIALLSDEIKPENDLSYAAVLRDQAGDEVSQDISFTIYDPDEKVVVKNLFFSGESYKFYINSNFTPGYWSVEAKSGDFIERKLFLVEELERSEFELVNNTLIVKNTGNVPYTKPLEVSIGRINEIVEVNLKVGESKVFTLSAPEGNYEIGVTDGSVSENFGSSFLTGNSISVEAEEGALNRLSSSIFWWVIVLLIGLVAVSHYNRTRKNLGLGVKMSVPTLMRRNSNNSIESGPVTSINQGTRQESAIVSLNVKNLNELSSSKEAIDSISSALMRAKNSGAKVYVDGNYRVMIFAPGITKSKNDPYSAIKVANEMKNLLNDYNNKGSGNINYGLGVHVGPLIVSSEGDKFKFTSLGNTINTPKHISEKSLGEVLLSSVAHGKVIGAVTSEKDLKTGFWKVKRIANRERHSKFIENFKKKQFSKENSVKGT